MHSANELYSDQVQNLPVPEQLRLATMILQGLTRSTVIAGKDYSDDWSDEDVRYLAAFSLRHASESLGQE